MIDTRRWIGPREQRLRKSAENNLEHAKKLFEEEYYRVMNKEIEPFKIAVRMDYLNSAIKFCWSHKLYDIAARYGY